MDKNVTTIFLSIALTIAFTQIASSPNDTSFLWWIFFYFTFRKVSYYAFDLRFADIAENIYKKETKIARMWNFFLGISTLFLFIVTGYFVTVPTKFFLLNAATLFLNAFWIVILMAAIDEEKDNNPKLPIRKIFKNYILINLFEIIICMITFFLITSKFSVDNLPYSEMEKYIQIFSIGGLFLIFLVDIVWHQDFLFDPNYSTESLN